MKISAFNRNKVQVTMAPSEAARLLEGLEALHEELGQVGEDLIALLRRKGITPPAKSGRGRTEYNGPEQ
jgi:hypothetical protein